MVLQLLLQVLHLAIKRLEERVMDGLPLTGNLDLSHLPPAVHGLDE